MIKPTHKVREWTLKEGRDAQWISKGPSFGRGKELVVIAKEDLQPFVDKLKYLLEHSTIDNSKRITEAAMDLIKAWEGE